MNRFRKFTGFLLAMICLFSATVVSAQAAEYKAEAALRVIQEFTVNDKSFSPEDTFPYELTALDGAPLPAQAENGKYSFQLKGNETKDFSIVYEHPGMYQYEMKQVIPEKKEGYTYDETVWTARVYVTNDSNGGLVSEVLLPLNPQGQKAKEDLPVHRFKNSYVKEVVAAGDNNDPNKPKKDPTAASKSHTGEETGSSSWAVIMMIGLAGLILFVVISRREGQKGEADGK